MAEHLYAHGFARRACDVLLLYGAVYGRHLVEIQFACQHHRVGVSGIEAHGLDIRYIALRGYVHRYAVPAACLQDGDVGAYHSRDACGFCGADYLVDACQVVVVDYGVHRQICPDAFGRASRGYVVEVVKSEVGARTRAHVQSGHAEVY